MFFMMILFIVMSLLVNTFLLRSFYFMKWSNISYFLFLMEGKKGLLLFIYDFRDCSYRMCFFVASREDWDMIGW